MSLRYEENMDDLTEIAALYLSFPYTIAEIEIAGFYVSSPYTMNQNLKMRLNHYLSSAYQLNVAKCKMSQVQTQYKGNMAL